jgi:hypothetical protein
MSQDFDELPVYDPITSNGDKFSGKWQDSLSTFWQTLVGYLTQFGIKIPRMTVAQRDSIKSPEEGQLIYTTNTTVGPPRTASLQIWQVKSDIGAWRTITTV